MASDSSTRDWSKMTAKGDPLSYLPATQGNRLLSSAKQAISSSSTVNLPAGNAEHKSDRDAEPTPSAGDSSLPAQPYTINIVIFGETGVGKSSVINLIAGTAIAEVSSDSYRCTIDCTGYSISFDGMDFAIFETVGLEEPDMWPIEKGYELILKLSAAGGIHLLLFCMRGGYITATARSNYRLFCECLCDGRVPIALVFTGLEKEVEMEDWWKRNVSAINHSGIRSTDHACITAVRSGTRGQNLKYMESQRRIREVLKTCAPKNKGFQLETYLCFARLMKVMKPNRQDAIRVLTRRCKLDRETTKEVADMMERGDMETEDWIPEILRVHERKRQCESLYTQGRTIEAIESLLEIMNTMSKAVKANKPIIDWTTEFTNRCVDKASDVKEHDKAISVYSTVLSLGPPPPKSVLTKWARMILIRHSADDVLNASTRLNIPRFIIYQTICNVLEGDDRITEAITYFRQMQTELAGNLNIRDEEAQWELGFQQRCTERLKRLGSIAMDSKDYSKAAEHFSTMLSLDSTNRMEILIKRSKARLLMKLWEDALSDADECIRLDLSSHQGYEMRHAALHGARRYAEAVEAFRMVLLKLERSPDEHVRELCCQYVDATSTIQHIVEGTIRDMPQVLIDTTTGCLHDKRQQAEAFKALPVYHELISSMTTEIDYARIWKEVKEFYRYVMLSHKWEYDEPLLQKVQRITIYKLETSSANIKLQTFCTIVRSLGFRWAWSDTCCVDKDNRRILEESLVAMFTWYRGSSLTIIYLRDVSSQSPKPDGLRKSIWNTRAWTYQEYVAAKVVQFYTEDWKPYLGLSMFNHKESPTIISEMQQLTTGSAKDIIVLQPGLDRVREKLSLASMRQATLVEDIAYSLFGIFNASISVQYGERDRAVGRLLEHILTGSGDVMILAWTGRAGSYNSCLPIDLTTYNQVLPPHVPQPIENSEMDSVVVALRSSSSTRTLAKTLYNRLIELPPPVSLSSRLRLPGIVFRLTGLVCSSSDVATKSHGYRATTSTFGDVEFKTADDLRNKRHLYVVHPWIRSLLDQEFMHGATELNETTQALRFVARLRQPFGALLLEQLSRVEYKRVAADSLIMVRIGKKVALTELIENIRTIEVQ